MDDHKLIVYISHNRISYEYWLPGEEGLKAAPGGTWPAPLAIMCTPTGIVIGEEAQRAARIGTENAFTGYFDLLADDVKYEYGGVRKDIRQLLLDASESVFREFYSQVLFRRRQDYRLSMPLILVCEADIANNQLQFLRGLFRDGGYGRLLSLNYADIIARYVNETVSKEYSVKHVLSAWAEGEDLTLTLFSVGGQSRPSITLRGLGVDPRQQFVVDRIWAQISGQNPWLSIERERDAIEREAIRFLNSSVSLWDSSVLLSDRYEYQISLVRNEISNLHTGDSKRMREEVNTFLAANGAQKASTLLLLRGTTSGNEYFENQLSGGFTQVIRADSKLRQRVMNMILEEEIPKEPNSVVSSGPIQPYPPDIPIPPIVEPLPPEPPKASEAVVKDLKKRWRPLRAEAPAKCKAGKAAEVAKKVDDFLKEAREKYAHEIVAMVEEWLHEHKDMFTTKAKEPEKPKAPRTTPKPKPTTPVPQTSTPKPAKTERSQGEAYIQDWKLKEALEWYRSNGPASIAKALSEVQRAKRGVDQRAAELSRLRTNPRPEQIQRIVEQLQQFLGLCRTAGLDPQKYQDLLREFRKIK